MALVLMAADRREDALHEHQGSCYQQYQLPRAMDVAGRLL